MAPIQFGILMVPYQTLDAAGPADVLASASKALLQSGVDAGLMSDATLPSRAVDIDFHHISTSLEPVELTASYKILPSTTVETCPELDYLLVGGPDITTYKLDPAFTKFLQDHVAKGKALFATCTGAACIASTGVLDGKRVTTNYLCLELVKQLYPKVNWVKEQWVEDGNIWTAATACAGMDMMAHWVSKHYDADVVAIGRGLLDFQPRDINGKFVEA